MFSDAKVGDKVWNFMYGWGVVKGTDFGQKYPIFVKFKNGLLDSFMYCGRRHKDDKYPTLFWDEIEYEIPKKPLPDLAIDTKVIVWNLPNDKKKKYFAGWDDRGNVVTFRGGATSWSAFDGILSWKHWELA